MPYLLDANAIAALLRDDRSPVALRVRHEPLANLAISSIVLHELFFGAFKSQRRGHNLAIFDALNFTVIEFNQDDARRAGLVRAELAVRGTPIGPYDVLIAGQALARSLTLVTHNTREFSRVPGLRIEDWQA